MRRLNSTALQTLRFFDVAARLLSFTRTAEELRVTQGAVSQHIKSLEHCLGCKLFFRLPGQIKLTTDGKMFSEVVSRALQDLEDAAQTVTAPDQSRINVRLRANPSFALRWLIPRLGRLKARHPRIKVHLVSEERRLDSTRRDFDLAIELAQAPSAGVHTELLMEDYLTPVCSPQYLYTHPFLRTPADLERATLLHAKCAGQPASEDTNWPYWLHHVGATTVDSSSGRFFTSATMAIEAALAHQGIALGNISLVDLSLAASALVTPFAKRIKSPTCYYLARARDLHNHVAVKDLTTWLHEEARNTVERCLHPSLPHGARFDTHTHIPAHIRPGVAQCAPTHLRAALVTP